MKEIQYKDIQKGDTIRRSMTIGDVTETRAGVVADKDSEGNWMTDGGSLISCIDRADYYLIDRPKPPLPTTPGTVFRATKIRGIECDVTVLVTGDPYGTNLYATSQPIKFALLHEAHHINAWEPIEVTA